MRASKDSSRAAKPPIPAREPLAATRQDKSTRYDHDAIRLPQIPWGRPSSRIRGTVAALGTEIRSINFTPKADRAAARSFDSIPVFCFSTAKGLGDLSSAISLVSGLRRAYPDKKIELILVEGLRPRPQLAPNLQKLTASGVVVRHLSPEEAKNYSATRLVSIQGIIPHTKGGGGSAFSDQMSSALNIYVPEYDPGPQYWNPTGMGLDQLCRDQSELLHIAVTSGFCEHALGLFFSSWADNPTPSMDRAQLLDALEIKRGTALWRRMQTTDWTVAYRNCCDIGREKLAEMVGQAAGEGKLARPVSILDFTNVDEWSINRHEKHLEYPSVLDKKNGVYVRPLTFTQEGWRVIETDGSHVIRLGKRASDVFQSALRLAQLPVEITGDASLTEAVALGLPFLYDAPPWKAWLRSYLVTHAVDTLPLASAEVFRGLYQEYRSHDPQRLVRYPEIEQLYLAHRDKLKAIYEEYLKSAYKSNSYEEMTARMDALLFTARIDNQPARHLSMACRTAIFESQANDLALELWVLKRSSILDSDYRRMEREENGRFEVDFVSNPARWEAFRELRAKSREELDFARNLRRLIDGLVHQHGLLR